MSLNDAVLLEKRGVPTALLCAGKFATLGQLQGKALGVPWLPIVVTPYPFGTLPEEALEKAAEDLVDEVAYVLTQPSEKLEKEYFERHVKAPNPLKAPRQSVAKPGVQ